MCLFPSHCSRVRKDIMNSLKLRDPCVTIGSFDRKNLFYGVKSFSRGALFVDELIGEVSKCVAAAGSTIIYCTTIKDVQQVILPMSLSLAFSMFSHNLFCQHTVQITLFGCMMGRNEGTVCYMVEENRVQRYGFTSIEYCS